MPQLTANSRGALISLAAFGVFATHDALIKQLAGRYSAIQIAFCIALFTFPLLLIMIASQRQSLTLIPKNPKWVVMRGLSGTGAGALAFYAFSVLPMAQVYVLLFATPLLVTLLAVPILGEKVGPRRAIAVAVGLVGVLIVLRPSSVEIGPGHFAGLGAALVSSGSAIITRKVGRQERPEVLVLYVMMTSFLVMGAALPMVYVPMRGIDLALVVMVACLSFTGMQLTIQAYRRAEAAIVAPMQYSQILWAIFYGMVFFAETPTATTLIGAAVVMASGLYIVFREAQVNIPQTPPALATPVKAEPASPPKIQD